MARDDTSPEALALLVRLGSYPWSAVGATATQLAALEGISPSLAGARLGALSSEGLARRTRGGLWQATPKGRSALDAATWPSWLAAYPDGPGRWRVTCRSCGARYASLRQPRRPEELEDLPSWCDRCGHGAGQ